MRFPWFRHRKTQGRPAPDVVGLSFRDQVEIPGIGVLPLGRRLDCLGASCPKPQLLTLKALNQVPPGDVVELISDNMTAVETIPAMMLSVLGTHLATIRQGRHWVVYVRREPEL